MRNKNELVPRCNTYNTYVVISAPTYVCITPKYKLIFAPHCTLFISSNCHR